MNQIFRGVMKILLLFSLICLVSAKHGTTSTTEKINLNFDSAIILEKRDIQGIKTFFENIVKLLEELNNATLPKTTPETIQRRRPREPKRDQYRRSGIINWMKNITKIFPNVTETKIKEAFNTVNDEVNRAVNYNGTTHILTEKKIIDYINHWRRHSKDIAKIINTTLNENNPLFNKIARRVNDYYSDADVKRLYNILREFKRYLENDMDTSNLVKQLMNSAIFKKYDSLSEAAKADLKKDFRTFAEYVSLDNILKFLDKNHDLTYSALRRSIDQKLKVARHVKKHKDDEGKSSELIVNNIELVLKPKVSVTQGDLPPRSVNVALETSFIFDPKDIHNSKSFINNLRRFLENLNDIQEPQLKSRYLRTVAKRKRTKPKQYRKFNLIDWVWDAGKSFVNLTGDTFNRAVDPIHQRAKKGKDKFGELAPDKNILDYIKIWRRQMPEDMKIKINTTLNENNPLLRKIARRMNAYYSDEDVKKLYDILWKFKRYLEKDKDTSNLVKELMNSAIFKKYDSLSEAAKADLKKDFRTFAEYVSMNNNLKSFNKNHGLSYTELRNTIDKKLKDARKGKKNKNKDGKTNELVVNNIELVLEPEVSVTQGDLPPRNVNVAPETYFIFVPKDIHDRKSFINNLRRFFENLEGIQTPPPKSTYLIMVAKVKRTKYKQYRKFDLVEWVKGAGKTTANFTTHFNKAVEGIKIGANKVAEVSKDTFEGVKTGANKFGKSIKDGINNITQKTKDKYEEVRTKKNLIEYIKFWRSKNPQKMLIIDTTPNNPLLRKIAKRMNAYYSDEDVKKLYNILWKFKRYLEKDKDTSNLVKELMHSAVLKKYNSLSEAAKADLKKDFRTFADHVSMNNNLKSFIKNHGLSYTELRTTIDKKLKDARKAKKNKNKDGKTNEFVVNNIELVLEPEGSKITF